MLEYYQSFAWKIVYHIIFYVSFCFPYVGGQIVNPHMPPLAARYASHG